MYGKLVGLMQVSSKSFSLSFSGKNELCCINWPYRIQYRIQFWCNSGAVNFVTAALLLGSPGQCLGGKEVINTCLSLRCKVLVLELLRTHWLNPLSPKVGFLLLSLAQGEEENNTDWI